MSEYRNPFSELLKNIPPNYPLGTIYLNGYPVMVTNFSTLNGKNGLAYFIGAEGQVVLVDADKIDGLNFAAAEAEEPAEEEEEAAE